MEAILKPDRAPDYVAPYGSAFWWHEMVYMGGNGHMAKMWFDGENNTLYMVNGGETSDKPDRAFAPQIRDMYNYYMYGAFEDAILTASENEKSTTKG